MGYALCDRMMRAFVSQSLWLAVSTLRPGRTLIHHSDRGSQYCSIAYWELLGQFTFQFYMSRKANCCYNTSKESFWRTLKNLTCLSQAVYHPAIGHRGDHGMDQNFLQPPTAPCLTGVSVTRSLCSTVLSKPASGLIFGVHYCRPTSSFSHTPAAMTNRLSANSMMISQRVDSTASRCPRDNSSSSRKSVTPSRPVNDCFW